jgi:hypothetical protein
MKQSARMKMLADQDLQALKREPMIIALVWAVQPMGGKAAQGIATFLFTAAIQSLQWQPDLQAHEKD